ncbi:MAG: hypothetical protein ACWA5P_11640 [bacterium]
MKQSNQSILRTLICALLFAVSYSLSAQEALTTSQWQEDLRFLQKTVNDDYAHLFKKVSASDWNNAVEAFHQDIPNLEDHEVLVGFARIVALFKYGHTIMSFRDGAVKYHKLPINLYHFNDGLFIEGTHQSHEAVLGARVVAIEGVPTEKALELLEPMVAAENEQFFKSYGINFLTIPEVLHAQKITSSLQQEVTFQLEKGGKTFEYTIATMPSEVVKTNYSVSKQEGEWLSARNQDSTPLYLKDLDKIYYYEYLPEEKAVYVRHSQIQDDASETTVDFYKRVFDFIDANDVEKFVLDVRLNGGGNNYLNKPIVTGVIQNEKINKIGHFFVITGRRTFSACQNLVNELDNYTNVLFVGEPTAENLNFYGDNKRVTLPNSQHTAYLSFAWWQDKPQWENEDWMAPQLPVTMSAAEYMNNEDPVLQKALNFVSDDFISDPMQHLYRLFSENKMQQLQQDAMMMIQDERYSFVDFEDQFNRSALNLMGTERNDGAIMVLQMTLQAYPNSARTWKNLGDVYVITKKAQEATSCYQKAIGLAPESDIATAAKAALSQLGGK